MQSELYYCELEKEEISKKEKKEILINLGKVFSNRKCNIYSINLWKVLYFQIERRIFPIKISKVFIFSNGINAICELNRIVVNWKKKRSRWMDSRTKIFFTCILLYRFERFHIYFLFISILSLSLSLNGMSRNRKRN